MYDLNRMQPSPDAKDSPRERLRAAFRTHPDESVLMQHIPLPEIEYLFWRSPVIMWYVRLIYSHAKESMVMASPITIAEANEAMAIIEEFGIVMRQYLQQLGPWKDICTATVGVARDVTHRSEASSRAWRLGPNL